MMSHIKHTLIHTKSILKCSKMSSSNIPVAPPMIKIIYKCLKVYSWYPISHEDSIATVALCSIANSYNMSVVLQKA